IYSKKFIATHSVTHSAAIFYMYYRSKIAERINVRTDENPVATGFFTSLVQSKLLGIFWFIIAA
ncbi:hypothetical protein VC897_21585, partial [Citrobacter youngae]|uniref:hypothetical protein n=1 Tax=Citrobacter youngae TaxID=133448 RepID=UPI002B229242